MGHEELKGIHLKASNFVVEDGKAVYTGANGIPGMLLIFATWCGHCKAFTGTFNDIAENIGPDFAMTSIESAELENQTELVEALKFTGYPTIAFFNQQGTVVGQHRGARDRDTILDSMCKLYHYCAKKW